MKRLVWGAALAVFVLLVGAVAVSANTLPFMGEKETSQSGASPKAVSRDIGNDGMLTQSSNQNQKGDKRPKAFLGIVIGSLGQDRANELGISGGVRVIQVAEEGPSAGTLKEGDIIVTIDGKEVKTPADVLSLLATLDPATTVSLEIIRGGQKLTVQVTLGSRQEYLQKNPRLGPFAHPFPDTLMGLLPLHNLGRIVRAEIVVDTDEGVKIFKILAGTVKTVDSNTKTLTLTPKDGSTDIPYRLTENTTIFLRGQKVELTRVLAGDEAVVVSVDGEVKWVMVQPEKVGPRLEPQPAPHHRFMPFGPPQRFHLGPQHGYNKQRIVEPSRRMMPPTQQQTIQPKSTQSPLGQM